MANAARSELHRLSEKRAAAAARAEQVEREGNEAAAAAQKASVALAEYERVGGSAADRRKLATALADAKSKAAEPWAERVAGARAALRDAEEATRAFTAANLTELVAAREKDGEAAAAALTEAASAVTAAYFRREQVAAEITTLVAAAGLRLRPGDVSYSKGEALSREAAAFVQAGGETAPTLLHDPREPRLGTAAAEADAA